MTGTEPNAMVKANRKHDNVKSRPLGFVLQKGCHIIPEFCDDTVNGYMISMFLYTFSIKRRFGKPP